MPRGRADMAHWAPYLKAALVFVGVAGLHPGIGPSSRALVLGVTRPVHPTQQKCTGRSGSSGSFLGQWLTT